MRFEIRLVTLFVLLGMVAMFVGVAKCNAGDDAVDVAKAKAKALFSLKATPAPQAVANILPLRDVTKAIAEAKATSKPLYLWVAKFRKEIAEKLPPGIHAIATEYHGLTDPYLVIKVEEGDYQLEQSKLDPERIQMIRRIVNPMSLRSESKRPPIIEVSRESVEPPLLAPSAVDLKFEHLGQITHWVSFSDSGEKCLGGKEKYVDQGLSQGLASRAKQQGLAVREFGQQEDAVWRRKLSANYPEIPDSSTIQAGSGIPSREVAVATWPAPVANHTGPVLFGERAGPAPVLGFFS